MNAMANHKKTKKQTKQKRAKLRSVLINISFMLAFLIVLFIIAEILTRVFSSVFFPACTDVVYKIFQKSEDPVLRYELKPNGHSQQDCVANSINSKGFRDREFPTERLGNIYRIAVLGDSVTYGLGLELNDTFAKQLERKLNAAEQARYSENPVQYEVLNFGVNGYNTPQEVRQYELLGSQHHPDMIIVNYILNDHVKEESREADSFKTEEHCKIAFIGLPVPCGVKNLAKKSAFLQMVFKRANAIRVKTTQKQTLGSESFLAINESSPDWKNVQTALNTLALETKDKNVTLVLVTFPVLYDLNDYHWKTSHDLIDAEGKKDGYITIDLLDNLTAYNGEDLRLNSKDIWHFNPAGMDVVTDIVAEKIEPLLHPATPSS
jgi:lysophospholipase L1-like esterase